MTGSRGVISPPSPAAGMSDNLDSIPLHDRARQSEKLARELIGHLENEYLPKVRELQAMIAPDAARPAGDLTVREGVRKVFLADATVDETWQQMHAHLESIVKDLRAIAHDRATGQSDTA